MYEEHIRDEDIKKFVSYHGTLKGEEGKTFIELSKSVNGHIRGCKDCLEKVTKAQREQDKIDGIEDRYVTDRSKHMRTVDEISDKIAEGLGISKETARELREKSEMFIEISEKMHDKGQPYMGHEDPKALEKTGKEIGDLPKQIATADKEAILKESELMPLKKKGFKEWIKGLVDKLMGKGEK